MIDGITYGPYDLDRERSPTVRLGADTEHKPRLAVRSRQGRTMTERQWELYRRSVVERMPDSDYKTAVLAGIAHKLMTLDYIEGFVSHQRRRSDAASVSV